MTTYKGIQELESNLFGGNARGSGLIREKPESYSSGLFSKLSYEDLKKAHTETLIPVTQNDFENRIGFNTVQELQTYRKQSDTLVGEKDSIHILKTMKEKEDRENVENAYKMMKQMEQIENKHNEWNSYFKQLTN